MMANAIPQLNRNGEERCPPFEELGPELKYSQVIHSFSNTSLCTGYPISKPYL